MVAGDEDFHDVVFADGGTHGEDSAAEGFAETEDIGGAVFELVGELFAGAIEADLDFIPDEENIFLIAELANLGHPAIRGHEDATFGLDWFAKNRDCVGGDRRFERFDIAKGYDFETGGEGAKVGFVSFFGAESDDGGGSTVEVILEDDDFGLSIGDALAGVSPLSGEFYGGFNGFGTGVHGADLVESAELGDAFKEESDFGVVESAGDNGDVIELFFEGVDDAGVEVSVGDGGVGADAVNVLVAGLIPDPGVFAFYDVDGEGFVVVGAVLVADLGGLFVSERFDHLAEIAVCDLVPEGEGLC